MHLVRSEWNNGFLSVLSVVEVGLRIPQTTQVGIDRDYYNVNKCEFVADLVITFRAGIKLRFSESFIRGEGGQYEGAGSG